MHESRPAMQIERGARRKRVPGRTSAPTRPGSSTRNNVEPNTTRCRFDGDSSSERHAIVRKCGCICGCIERGDRCDTRVTGQWKCRGYAHVCFSIL